MWKNRVFYLLVLLGMAVFFLEYSGWISCYCLLLTLVLPVFSLLCSLPGCLGLRAEISADGDGRKGGTSEVCIRLPARHTHPCRFWIWTRDLLGGGERWQKTVTHDLVQTPVPTPHCGIYACGVKKAFTYDFLGLFRFRVRTGAQVRITVLPEAVAPAQLPDFSALRPQRFHEKPGGGFAEVHEIRPYRPGDSMKSVHWKLSAKTDQVLVRQPQLPEYRPAYLTFDCPADRERLDDVLGRLRWVSEKMLELELPHQICSAAPEGGVRVTPIDSPRALRAFFLQLLQAPVTNLEGWAGAQTDWVCHIAAEEEV